MQLLSILFLILLHLGPASYSVYHILLYKRDSRAALGWIMSCIFIPYGGPVAYFFFGINRVRSRARSIKRQLFKIPFESGFAKRAINVAEGAELDKIAERITGTALSAGNNITIYHNGDEAYPAMLKSIAAAKQRILLTTYILKTDETGQAFIDALSQANQRGVEVKVILDGIGELYSLTKPSKLLKRYGISVAKFTPPRLFPPNIYINMRNHRKLLIIDNDFAYAGGMNISDEHRDTPLKARRITDIHFGFEGPVIKGLVDTFYDDWLIASNTKLDCSLPPPRQFSEGHHCRVIPEDPDESLDALSLTIQSLISAAKHSISIMTPYFIPSREMIAALQSASMRGVNVRIVLPGKNNLMYVHWANRNMLSELLAWNVNIFYQPAPFCHSKLFCVDTQYSLVGSANLDPRSLRLNYELGIEIFSHTINQQLTQHIDETISKSRAITFEELECRKILIRLRDSVMSLFSPYL
ncbi:hypothetical protein LCGC14_0823150 [marine sediment metagenome]|uniref:PLD phosphodiesterase domain-containing protein n=1 Tax=marine sediment metagenome TaxID=412755 RepID=A0A0F9PI65_9ZZZZ